MKAYDVFLDFLQTKNLKMTNQRGVILTTMLKSGKHLSTDEIYQKVRSVDASIGHATVFRTVKLLVEAEIASTIDFGDRITRYQITYGHTHHDHLVCVSCGKFIEADNGELAELQQKLKESYNFTMLRHKIKILGICEDCS